jgi:hypothetical protein
MSLTHLSTSTPASEVSRADFERDEMGYSAELEAKSLDDILRNSPAASLLGLKDEESLPDENDEEPTPEESEEETEEKVPDEASEDADDDETDESDQDSDEEDKTDEDDTSTQDADLPTEEDIDWEYKVPVTVDGKTEYVTLEEIRKGYATDKHLSQKGRELGELKKQVEEERQTKLQELIQLGSVLHEELTSEETNLGQKYHELSAQIEKARDEGDTYTARELKEQRESIQEKYWAIRNKREEQTKKVVEQIQIKQAEEQQKLLESFNTDIKELMPEFSEKVAKSIREFALKEGIPETLLESVYDARVVKFINDYRKLKEAQAAGSAKRKVAPTAKSVPSKKGTPQNVKEQRQGDALRAKALSGSASKDEELDFLKRISSLSKKL